MSGARRFPAWFHGAFHSDPFGIERTPAEVEAMIADSREAISRRARFALVEPELCPGCGSGFIIHALVHDGGVRRLVRACADCGQRITRRVQA